MTQVRAATPADVGAIVALGEAVVPSTYGPIDAGYAEWTQARWWSHGAVEDALDRLPHWVADDAGRVVGVANLGALDGTPVMWKLYVHPDRHGRGLGSALLSAVEAAVDGPVLALEYLAGNEPAARFYRRKGFTEARRAPMAEFPSVEQVWMRKEL